MKRGHIDRMQIDNNIDGHRDSMKELAKGQFFENCTVMGDLKVAPAVHFNFPLQTFSLFITFKSEFAAAGEPIPSE